MSSTEQPATDRDTMAKVQRMFRATHPIFGTETDVSAESGR